MQSSRGIRPSRCNSRSHLPLVILYLICLYGLCCPLRLIIPISLSSTHIQDMKRPLGRARSAKVPLLSFRITSKSETLFAVPSPANLEYHVTSRGQLQGGSLRS